MRQVRQIDVRGTYALVPLTRGLVSVIDAADVPLVERWNWSADVRAGKHTTYAGRNTRPAPGVRSWVSLHRFVLDAPPGQGVDHINGDGLDNRRENLRLCGASGNNYNSARHAAPSACGVRNVSKLAGVNKWRVHVRAEGKVAYVETFDNLLDAAIAAEEARERLHGAFAWKR